jgi:predicted enzyme related to lactoylglutathione lyase
MEKVAGIGGIFFKADDADALRRWYKEHLGVDVDLTYGYAQYDMTVWSIIKSSAKQFDPSTKPFMINYRVDDLDAMLDQLRRAGVAVEEKIDDSEYGRFGWAMDPEGNRIELWQPPKPKS